MIELRISRSAGISMSRYYLSGGELTKSWSVKDLDFEQLDIVSKPVTQGLF